MHHPNRISRTAPRRVVRGALCVLALGAGLAVAPPASAHSAAEHHSSHRDCDPADSAAVISWNGIAAAALGTDAAMPAPTMGVGMAYVEAAVYNAVVGITGHHPLYQWTTRGPRGASTDAAVAAAARAVLDHYFPVAHARVDAAYTAAVSEIPDGWAKTAGLSYGLRAAEHLVSDRAGDGWMAPVTYNRSPAPGVWRPTPPASAPFLAPWLGTMKPFLLKSSDQFRPGPAPELSSKQYAADLAEVASVGSVTSTTRTAAQTEVAKFFGGNLTVQLQGAYRDHLSRHCMSAADAARYLAVTNLAAADALITAWDAKSTYARWRPITAIRQADTDGNPLTEADPTWTPLVATPPFPEYVGAHCAVIGAVTRALQVVYETSRIDLNLASTVTSTTRHYENAETLRADGIGARIWGGIHYRTSDEVGNRVGLMVGGWIGWSLHR